MVKLESEVERLRSENQHLKDRNKAVRGQATAVLLLFVGKRLSTASRELKEQLQLWYDGITQDPPMTALVDFAEASVRRWVRVGMFGFAAALIPTVAIIVQTTLLARQNRYINEQNKLFDAQNAMITTQSELMSEQNDRLDKQNKLMSTQNEKMVEQNELLVEEKVANREQWAETHKVELLHLLYAGMDKRCTSGEKNRRLGGVPRECHPDASIREREQAVQLYITLERERPSLGEGAPVGLAFLNLQDAYLPGVDMAGVDLYGALFYNTKLPGAQLYGASFRNGILDETNFKGADLREADFRGAVLVDASFEGADLTGAKFLEGDGEPVPKTYATQIDGVDWTGATCPDGTKLAGAAPRDEETGKKGASPTCEGHFLGSAR